MARGEDGAIFAGKGRRFIRHFGSAAATYLSKSLVWWHDDAMVSMIQFSRRHLSGVVLLQNSALP